MEHKKKLMKFALMGITVALSTTTTPVEASGSTSEADFTGTLLAGGCGGSSRGSHSCSGYSNRSAYSCSGYQTQSCHGYQTQSCHSYQTQSCNGYQQQSCNGYQQQSCNGYQQQSYGGYTSHGCGTQAGQTVQHSCTGQSSGTGHQCGSAGHGCSSSKASSTNAQTPVDASGAKVEMNKQTTPAADQQQSRNQSGSNHYSISQTTNTAGTIKGDTARGADQARAQGTTSSTGTPQNMLPNSRQSMNPVNNTTPDTSTGSSSRGN